MLKHIVFSQKNAAKKEKCVETAEKEKQKWSNISVRTYYGSIKIKKKKKLL